MLTFYLLRSIKRKPLRHLSLFWVLMCAFLLPLVVSIYRDSMMYGSYLQTMDFSKGQAVHIAGVQAEDTALLRGIDGLTEPYFEDRWIYMNFDSDESWDKFSDMGNKVQLVNLITSRLAEKGYSAKDIEITFYQYDDVYGIMHDPLLISKWQQLLILSLVLTLFSGLIVQSAYRNHIKTFSQELAELSALGASKSQIVKMFLLELFVLFPLAAAGAVGISYAVMRILYKNFLEQTVDATLIWQVFHIDPKNTAIQIGFYLLVCLGALCFALLRKPGQKQITKGKRASSLSRLWVQQTKPPFMLCLCILVPLVTAFVILFNQYLSTYASFLEHSQSVEMSIGSGFSGVRQEEIDYLAGLNGIRDIRPVRKMNDMYHLYAPDGNNLYGTLHRYQDFAPGEPDLEKHQFVSNLPDDYKNGEKFGLYSESYKNQTSLTLVGLISPEGGMPGPFDIYISDALMDELEANAPIQRVYFYTTLEYAPTLEETIRANIPAHYFITNTGSDDVAGAALQVGHLWLLSWIFCALMIVALQIVWVQLSGYVRECGPMLRTVYCLGASRKQLSRLIPVWRAAIPAALLPFLIAVPYTLLETWFRLGFLGTFLVSLPLLGIYAGIAVLAALAFLLPVKFALRKIQIP